MREARTGRGFGMLFLVCNGTKQTLFCIQSTFHWLPLVYIYFPTELVGRAHLQCCTIPSRSSFLYKPYLFSSYSIYSAYWSFAKNTTHLLDNWIDISLLVFHLSLNIVFLILIYPIVQRNKRFSRNVYAPQMLNIAIACPLLHWRQGEYSPSFYESKFRHCLYKLISWITKNELLFIIRHPTQKFMVLDKCNNIVHNLWDFYCLN